MPNGVAISLRTNIWDRIAGGELDPPAPLVREPIPEPPAGVILGGALGFFLVAQWAIRRRTAARPEASRPVPRRSEHPRGPAHRAGVQAGVRGRHLEAPGRTEDGNAKSDL